MGGGERVADYFAAEITEDSSSSERSPSSCSLDRHKDSYLGDAPGGLQGAPSLGRARDEEIARRRRCNTYCDLLLSYKSFCSSYRDIQEAKDAIKRYKPGDWIEEVGGRKAFDYEIPATTTLLLVGPRGSGKSTLVNRISRAFEDDGNFPDRAQVSYNVSATEGTCFLKEYGIPRNSKSFCIYDSRSLSQIPSDNFSLLERWMSQGVSHGEMVIRDSDEVITRKSIKAMACQGQFYPCQRRTVNFVIFVVDGISVLKAIGNKDAQYINMLVETFNYSFLSFKDDRPVVVVTHGDELSLADRACVRTHLGELLGILPAKQIFDISATSDYASELPIVDMLCYAIERAEQNFPLKPNYILQVQKLLRLMYRLLSSDERALILEVCVICLSITVLLLKVLGSS